MKVHVHITLVKNILKAGKKKSLDLDYKSFSNYLEHLILEDTKY